MAAENAQVLAWGECEITVEPISGSGAIIQETVVFPIPVDDSTQLNPTQGTKQEATVEGGDVVAVRTDKAKYELITEIRLHSTQKTPPLGDGDGPVPGEYKVTVTPLENTTAPKLQFNRCSASAMYKYTSNDGIHVQYNFDVLKPSEGPKISVL